MSTNELTNSCKRVQDAIKALQNGKGVLLMDEESRENEGDLIYAAESLTETQMAKLIRYCSGIVCLCLPEAHLEKLGLPMMVEENQSRYGTGFTVSIEARSGVSTGVSAKDRVTTIMAALDDENGKNKLVSPGHVFPLRAKKGGVLTRPGHTEGSVDLVSLAGLKPAAVLCELMNDDGTMARFEQVQKFAEEHDYPIVTIMDIINYRESEKLAKVA